ncbi:MAG: hypothetical protein ACOX7B_03375 [Christensenellales bacterium]|jgi:hypothetical protein
MTKQEAIAELQAIIDTTEEIQAYSQGDNAMSGILTGRCGAITSTIKLVSKARMHDIIDRHWNSAGNTRDYQARYLTREGNGWVACDNTTGDCWVEEFLTAKEAVKWLMAA